MIDTTNSRQSLAATDPRVSALFSKFWLGLWALVLAVGWLLPNHYPPWSSFHMDTWIAAVLALASAAVFLRSTGPIVWHGMATLGAVLICVPMLQYEFGLITLAGTAWISSAYLIGFLLALLTGARWEMATPGQFADGLFLAIGIAALVSVGLQLHQWLSLDLLNIWSMGDGYGRPFANFGQPNQLGTFLVWGLLSAVWGNVRQRIGGWTAVFMAAYLLFGIALTASRTAWVVVAVLVAACWAWRDLWGNRKLPWVATGLGLYFAVCVTAVGWLGQLLLITLPLDIGDMARISGEQRPIVWSLFMDAMWQHPWIGYGWNQVGLAQLTAALDHPSLQAPFFHAHNLFLDFVLWCGVPVGLLISVLLLRWFWLCLRTVRSAENAVLVLVLLVVANHAMLELPLHYAYFLLPVGLVMGALNVRMKFRPLLVIGQWSYFAVWCASVTLLVLIVRDYARVESSYQSLRFEWAHIKYETRGEPPKVLLLTQWHEFIRLARFEPSTGMSPEELNWMRNVAGSYPNAGAFHKLAAAMAMNQRLDEAQLWLRRTCKVVPKPQCDAVKNAWASQSKQDPLIAAVPWPN